MGYRCAVSTCRNHNPRTRIFDKSVKYYQFPKVPEIRAKWIAVCQRVDHFPADNSYICSEHFTQNDFHRDLKAELMNLPPKRNLVSDAIPTQNLTTNPRIDEDIPNILRKHKDPGIPNISKDNKENLTKSDANGVNNGFIISYLGVPRLLITAPNSKTSDDSKTSSEGSQSRIISVNSEYASDIRSTFYSQDESVGQMEHLTESIPDKNIFKLDDLCRLCGCYSNRMKAIFEQSQYNYYEIISNHFPDIKIQKEDILPLSICSRCETTLVNWYQFYKTCNIVNKRFQSILKKLTEVPPVVIPKEVPENPKLTIQNIEAMETASYENTDDNDIVYEDDSVGEIEIVEVTAEPEEADTVDVFPEEKLVESVPEEIPVEIVEEKFDPLASEQFESKIHKIVIDSVENELKEVKKEVECVQIKDEIIEKNEVEILPRSSDLLKMKSRETLAARRRRRRRIPTLNLRRMCHICGKIFKYPESLRRHLKTVHSDERPFKCHQCTSSFNRNHNLTIHIKVVHQRQKVYEKKHVPRLCDYCGKVLLSARSLEEHISSIHTKKALYECDKCHSTFYRKLTYDKHRASNECDSANPQKCNAPKPEESFHKFCEHCGLEFKKEHFYKKHKLKHNSNFTCPVCSVNFAEGTSLKEHVESQHPEMKPFKCDQCGKKFKNKPLLNCHLIIHTGEKRYQCPHCSLKFLKKKYLSTHILVHTGERPFVCSICNKGFKQSGDMRKHKATHMRKQM
ncbi:zinc finger protein 62 homolog [Planococcus citri]|uniref:zinc finger protein 62 homolog n=1 Tax=Planococcus citri TaxID=170843 RepID=UPI0031F8B098